MAFQGVVIDYQEATSCKMASLTKGCSCCFKMALICSCISWAPSCEWICNVLFECLRGYVWLKLFYDLIGYLVVLKVLQQLQIESNQVLLHRKYSPFCSERLCQRTWATWMVPEFLPANSEINDHSLALFHGLSKFRVQCIATVME